MHEADWLVARRVLKMNWEEIARNLGISSRHLRRYRRGEWDVPLSVEMALQGLICKEVHAERQPKLEVPEDVAARALVRRLATTGG